MACQSLDARNQSLCMALVTLPFRIRKKDHPHPSLPASISGWRKLVTPSSHSVLSQGLGTYRDIFYSVWLIEYPEYNFTCIGHVHLLFVYMLNSWRINIAKAHYGGVYSLIE